MDSILATRFALVLTFVRLTFAGSTQYEKSFEREGVSLPRRLSSTSDIGAQVFRGVRTKL